MQPIRRTAFIAVLVTMTLQMPELHSDEGMWLYNNVPVEYLQKKHDFKVTREWLEHLQKSSVRFNSGGSGSFVSPDGLVLTNHHVGADALQKLGTKEKNYYRDGFLARTRAEELRCEAMELNVLMEIQDVTARVNGAIPADTPSDKAAGLRRAVINTIEKEAKEKTGLQPQVVTLYQGGAYHLYLFKKYTDVRLVFAPEQAIAFFGGDPDNFEYPRYDLDICFFRVYEDGKPARIKHYLTWARKPLAEGDLIFVSGHPGRTSRINTVAELEYLRDTSFPFLMQRLNRLEVLLSTFSDRSEENRRQAKEFLFSVQNSRKARTGGLAALLDPTLMAAKKKEEARLKAKAQSDESLASARTAWDRIAKAQKVRAQKIRRFTLLEGRAGFLTDYFGIARTLLRAAEERAKPNNERLPEFGEARLESLTEQLFSNEPIYDDFEIVKLTDSLTFLASELGYNDPLVRKVLAGKSPIERARELVGGCQVKKVEERKKLYEGGQKALEESKCQMIALARTVDAESRDLRKTMETQVDEVAKQAYGEIAKVKFALDGTKTYPDATFTLRLAFGLVKGFMEGDRKIPFATDFAGLYARSAEFKNREPFELPKRWIERKDKLDLKTPFNFVSTADIIGGNSGSPVVNRAGEFVGIIFDGNIQSLRLDFAYDDVEARAVSVDAMGIMESLRKIYEATELADELQGKKE
ncbi:MAG: S46 family peptidase [Gemmataceae bacterium]